MVQAVRLQAGREGAPCALEQALYLPHAHVVPTRQVSHRELRVAIVAGHVGAQGGQAGGGFAALARSPPARKSRIGANGTD